MFTALGICAFLAGSPATTDVRSIVDQIRREHGLASVRPNSSLQKAATSHTEYMRTNRTAGHGETPNGDGYTGRTPGDRARYFGYRGSNSEAVAWGDFELEGMVRGLFDAPYHRVLFLQPQSPDFGAGFVEGVLCIKFGGESGDGAVLSPANGARNVQTKWDGIETPDPLRNTIMQGAVGYPIVLAVFGSEAQGFRSINAAMVGPNGRVATIVLNPASDPHAQDAVIVIPQKPLQRAATYTVTFTYASKGGEKTTRTTFATAR